MAIILLGFPQLIKGKEDRYQYGSNLLLIGCLMAASTVIAGLLLSHEEGYEYEALQLHKWTGLAVFWLSSLLYLFLQKSSPLLQKAGIGIVAISIFMSGHFGAAITHGEDFIMAPLSKNDEIEINLEEAEVFAHVVMPILETKCVSCHKASKLKGELRLDNPKYIKAGGESGPVVVPGDIDNSLMISQINLPLEDEKHMPPKGKPQLSDEEKALLVAWIESGADFDKKLVAFHDTLPIYQLAVGKFAVKTKAYNFDPADSKKITSLNNFYRKVQVLAMDSPALAVSYFGKSNFKSESLLELKDINEQIVSINLNNIHLDDKDLALLENFPNLEKLYLNFSNIKGEGIKHLVVLEKLELLSIAGNQLEGAALGHLIALKNLKQLYIWNTGLDEVAAEKLKNALPRTYIETGYRD
ncbi:hypothetical protein BH24BAC1_BH24BAC1_35280 [soil metagenome]